MKIKLRPLFSKTKLITQNQETLTLENLDYIICVSLDLQNNDIIMFTCSYINPTFINIFSIVKHFYAIYGTLFIITYHV